jgi:bifunctional oligoribonuclease and PAP phosphatase NrnA
MALSQPSITAATRAILENQRLLVIPHANVDPDGLSSALACYQLFTALGKEVTVICPDTKPEMLEFLPGFEHLSESLQHTQQFVITVNLDAGVEVDKLRYTVEDNKVNIIVVPSNGTIQPQHVTLGEGEKPYDLLVAVDTADLALFGSMYTDHVDLFSQVPILNVDHHISNTKYGQLQLIDSTAASATEVLYHWFTQEPEWKTHLNADIATLLLTGLITDTRSFQNPNTTPRSLEVAAELLELGARQQEIIQHIYKTKPLSTLRIWGRALNRIQMDADARIVWSSISTDDLAEMGATSKETHGILDELISTIPDADVHVLFTELEEGGLKASTRSSSAIDVSALTGELFGGGGHERAAGFRFSKYTNFDLAVLECVSKLKEGMEKQRTGGEREQGTNLRRGYGRQAGTGDPPTPTGLRRASRGVDVVQQLSSEEVVEEGTDVVEGMNSEQ